MNLSDPSDDDSSSDESPVPAKRPRTDTYGASSTTSHGSIIQESDEDSPEPQFSDNYGANSQKTNKNRLSYREQSPNRLNRLSRSSLSENCSSPTDQYDDFRPGFKDNDSEDGSVRPSFQKSNDNAFYNKTSDDYKESDSYTGVGYSEISKRMMSNMGHKPGRGLGKFEHGRVEPVEASTQKGRRGLGLKPSVVGEVPRDFKWSPDEAVPEAQEEINWIPSAPEETLYGDILEQWLKKGKKKTIIEDETEFVDPQILKGILNSKTIFDNLEGEDMRLARTRSNPYETIGSVIFLNRAAVKMANIDAVFDFMFTNPKKPSGEPAVDKKDLLYFADVCAGPGGFSEYVLYRKGWRAKGFGFTLKGSNDFKLSDFYAGAPETFNPYYGVKEDGNIFDPANLSSLKEFVLKQTDDVGVHFLMADGGFSVDGQENIQEILSKQLYLCQCLAALMLVRTGGHFVCKLFDVFTQFSVGLIYIMYRCFEKVCIFKPVTSRPANSERYIVCKCKKAGTESVEKHLFSVNSILWNNRTKDDDVTQLVPLSVIQEDRAFYEYIYKSNCVIGERQIKNLLKIAEFSKNKSLQEDSQADMREQCLKLWNLPDKVRTKPERRSADDTLSHILKTSAKTQSESHSVYSFKNSILNRQPKYLEKSSDLSSTFINVYDWHFTFLSSVKGSSDLKIFIACGGKQVYQLDGTNWRNVADLHLTLPAHTLLYGEIVREYRGEGNNQMHNKALHVIDALMLGGIDISLMPLTDRINQCTLFCNALEKTDDTQALPIRCKRFYPLESFPTSVDNLEYRAMKRIKKALTVDIPKRGNRNDMFHTVGSLLFIKELKEPWIAQISKKSGCKYYYCIGPDRKPRSEYYIPEAAGLDMLSAYSNRILWNWEAASAIFEGHPNAPMTRSHMEEYIRRQT
ncbi:cap-specific mRNA (nucleoside-2'-O-)-methyltransferase 1 [Danaus plexippus]|uniref:cap-specific mRNA (nucleoside-2'-O-)-methyltransferase 1 n=1 Tax=Danaus plexippus TaxID=13037 RepID=UPI002AB2099C|nr:cap-specific mRNA (nucleoside-2'-O-)-methyltransferase 1 [Danaus plexippus]